MNNKIEIDAEVLMKELKHELRKVETNIQLTIIVDPHGDAQSMPLITAHIGSSLAPRDCSGIAAACQQLSLFNTAGISEATADA